MSNLHTYKETIQSLEETNNSLLSYRTNDIVRTLTVFSVLLLPLAFISQLFGMNTTSLPFSGNPHDFGIVMAMLFAALLITIAYFKGKRWF